MYLNERKVDGLAEAEVLANEFAVTHKSVSGNSHGVLGVYIGVSLGVLRDLVFQYLNPGRLRGVGFYLR